MSKIGSISHHLIYIPTACSPLKQCHKLGTILYFSENTVINTNPLRIQAPTQCAVQVLPHVQSFRLYSNEVFQTNCLKIWGLSKLKINFNSFPAAAFLTFQVQCELWFEMVLSYATTAILTNNPNDWAQSTIQNIPLLIRLLQQWVISFYKLSRNRQSFLGQKTGLFDRGCLTSQGWLTMHSHWWQGSSLRWKTVPFL